MAHLCLEFIGAIQVILIELLGTRTFLLLGTFGRRLCERVMQLLLLLTLTHVGLMLGKQLVGKVNGFTAHCIR